MSRRRCGFGIILGLAVFFVLIFSIGGISLGGFSSRVKIDVRTGQDIARAHAMAHAAVEELAFLVQTMSSSASTDVGRMLRDVSVRLPADGIALPLPIGADGPPTFAKLVAPAYPELKLLSASAKLVDIRGFRTTVLPWHGDHYGTVVLQTRVSTRRADTEVVAERWLEFKMFHAALTPPFDLTSLAMVDPWGWCHGHARYTEKNNDENTNYLIAEILTDVKEAEAQIKDLKQRVKKLEGVAPDAAAEVKAGIRDAEQLLGAPTNRELISWWEGSSPEPDHKFMRTPHLRYVLMSKELSGAKVNLPAILAPQTPVRLKEYKETERLRKALDRDISSESEALAILRPLHRSSLALLQVDMQMLADVRRVQEMFVRRVGPTQMDLFSRHLAILREGTADRTDVTGSSAVFTAGRVTHRVSPAGLQKLLQDYGSPFTGIVEVVNSGEPLLLPGPLADFQGRIVLDVQGDVTIESMKVSRADGRARGLITVICHGTLRARGDVDASLVALDRFVVGGALTLHGNLFLDGYRGQVFRDGPPEDVLKNVTIIEDPRVRALDPSNIGGAPKPESYSVVFGPRPIRDVVRRVAAEGGR